MLHNVSALSKNTTFQMPNFLLTNVRSLRYKIDELECVINNNFVNICCVTESWLNESISTESINIAGFVCHKHDRESGHKGGGVVCYVDEDWPCTRLQSLETDDIETLWLLVCKPRMPRYVSHIVICVVYHPPGNGNDGAIMCQHIVNGIDSITQQHPYAGIVILGDFNHMTDQQIRSYPLKQLVTKSTRQQAILDKIYTNIDEWYEAAEILPNIGSSDHQSVALTAKHQTNRHSENRIVVNVRTNNRNGRNLLANALYNHDWSEMELLQSVDEKADYFTNCITSYLNYYMPARSVVRHTNDKPWVTDEFRRMIRQRQFAFTHHQTHSFKKLRNKIQRMSKQLRRKYYEKRVLPFFELNNVKWWHEIKKFTGQSSKTFLNSLADKCTEGNLQRLAEMINETFANWSSDLNPLPSNYEELNLHLNTDELKTIQPYEVFNYLSKINIRKSGGPDDIPNWILRDFAFALADPVSHIFNQSLKLGKVPKLWKMANVVVIPKSNPPSSIETDLRPISLTPTLSKILESIIGHWALPNIRPQLDCRQYGGIEGRSTTHELITTILHQCHEAVENHKIVRMLLIDFKKAFDHVDHNIVIRKLTELNVKPFIVRWIFSFLQNRQQRIKIGDITSSWSALNGGMPQGSWLGPLIFIILINDLRAEDELFKFIDDVTLLDEIDRTNLSSSSAQSSLDTIAEWSDENFMTINIKKTKEIIYNISRNKIDLPKLSLSGSDIEQVETYKLLGVVLSNDLRWDEHVSYINKSQQTYSLPEAIETFWSSNSCSVTLLYNCYPICHRIRSSCVAIESKQ